MMTKPRQTKPHTIDSLKARIIDNMRSMIRGQIKSGTGGTYVDPDIRGDLNKLYGGKLSELLSDIDAQLAAGNCEVYVNAGTVWISFDRSQLKTLICRVDTVGRIGRKHIPVLMIKDGTH